MRRTFVLGLGTMLLAVPGCGNLPGPKDANLSPDADICEQLAGAAQAQVESYLQSGYSLACQVDSDCSFLQSRPLSCFAVCGNVVMRTADVSTVLAATATVCDKYFAAGCPEKHPPCPYSRPACDHGTCARSGMFLFPDAASDAGAAELPVDGSVDFASTEAGGEVAAGAEGETYRQGPYLCCAKGDGTQCCAGEQQGFCFEYGGLYESCRAEGEEYEGKIICAHCCRGLERVASADVVATDDGARECRYGPPSLLRCVHCGDGTCGVGENPCNCPIDCGG